MMQEVVSTENDVAELDMDIIIADAPDAATTQVEDFQVLGEMVKSGFPMPPIAVIEASPLSNKDKIIKMMKEQPQVSPEHQKQMQQMQEEMKKLAQENQQLRMGTQEAMEELALKKKVAEEEDALAKARAEREMALKEWVAREELRIKSLDSNRENDLAMKDQKFDHMLDRMTAMHDMMMAEREARAKAKDGNGSQAAA